MKTLKKKIKYIIIVAVKTYQMKSAFFTLL